MFKESFFVFLFFVFWTFILTKTNYPIYSWSIFIINFLLYIFYNLDGLAVLNVEK